MRKRNHDLGRIKSLVQEIEGVIDRFEKLESKSRSDLVKSQASDLQKQLKNIQSQIKDLS
jgi:hypothetical protein